ncbi:MAG: hypothetical protein KC613_22860, partial [Myxococcales bacterium]|nr:hypothetical protein [Myxococcales bacterium]
GALYAYLHATVDWERAPDFPEESLQYVREVGWVIRLAPDGAVWPLANPIVQRHAYVPGTIDQTIFFPGLLRNVSHVTWSPRLDAAMVWPVEHLDFTWVDFGDRLTAGGVGPAIPPTGWGGGAGAAFFPVAGEGDGYQTWREALIREARDGQCVPDTVLNSSLAGCMGLTVVPVPAADGRLGVVRLAEGGFQFRGLDLNGSQDLDGDGLSADAEAGLGTSDFLADSDGGGVQDRHEVEFFGTDPLTPGDDPGRASRLAGPRVYDSSPLVQLRLPERIAQTGTAPLLARSLSNRGPVCVQGRCYDAAGAVVSDYSDHPRQLEDGPANAQTVSRIRVPEVKSADGQFLVLQDNQGLTRHDLADGRRTLWVPWARLLEDFPIEPARFGSAALMQVFPVDRDRLFVAWDDGRLGEPARVVRYDGAGQGTRVFDLAALCAQAGLPCTLDFRDNALRQDMWLGHFEVIGWSEPLQRLLLRVWTRFDMPILGVDAEGDVARVEGLYENLAQVTLAEPWQAQPPFPVVDAFRAQIRPGEWFTGQDVIDAGEVAQPAQLGILPVYGAPFGGWGDSLLHYHYAQRAEGLYEIVPVPLDLAPGDVLFFANLEFSDPEGADRPMLFRLNRRGGIAPVWTEYKGVARGTGLDVNAAFEVCVADGEQVVLFAPDGSTGNRPEAEQGRWTLPGVSDCQLVDGQVLALVGEQVFRLNGEAFEATGETAQAFYRDPHGRPARLAVGEDLWEVLVPEGLPEGV